MKIKYLISSLILITLFGCNINVDDENSNNSDSDFNDPTNEIIYTGSTRNEVIQIINFANYNLSINEGDFVNSDTILGTNQNIDLLNQSIDSKNHQKDMLIQSNEYHNINLQGLNSIVKKLEKSNEDLQKNKDSLSVHITDIDSTIEIELDENKLKELEEEKKELMSQIEKIIIDLDNNNQSIEDTNLLINEVNLSVNSVIQQINVLEMEINNIERTKFLISTNSGIISSISILDNTIEISSISTLIDVPISENEILFFENSTNIACTLNYEDRSIPCEFIDVQNSENILGNNNLNFIARLKTEEIYKNGLSVDVKINTLRQDE